MKLLLDTHAFLWWDSNPNRIPSSTLHQLENPSNELLISIASLWEIQIKVQLNKLTIRTGLAKVVQQQQTKNGINLLPITLPHILELEQLAPHHKDPFDRIIIAQSRIEASTIVTRDRTFQKYECKTVW